MLRPLTLRFSIATSLIFKAAIAIGLTLLRRGFEEEQLLLKGLQLDSQGTNEFFDTPYWDSPIASDGHVLAK